MKKYKSYLIVYLFLMLNAFFAIGCKEDAVTTQGDNLDMSVMSSDDINGIPPSVLILNEVKVLIKDIKLNVANSAEEKNFKTGPFVFYLNFTTSVTTFGTAYIPPGTYDKIIFKIHKLEDNETPPDPEFLDGNERYSVIVKGSYNGVPFIFKSDKSAHQKLDFPNSLFITTTGLSNITIHARPYLWFYKNNNLLDPNDPSNRNDIENNIKDNINSNLKAFKDMNKDGLPDG